ncbi:hypothetical protein UlMin_036333, partial [Ulmus minor]
SVLTDESLPATNGSAGSFDSGSTCKPGKIEAVVIATGVRTYFGKAAQIVDSANQQYHFQKRLLSCTQFNIENTDQQLTMCWFCLLEEFQLPCRQFYLYQWRQVPNAYLC